MRTPTPTPDAGEREAPPRELRSRDKPLLALVAFLAVLGFVWGVQTYEREHDAHVVRQIVRDLEVRIRSHQEPALFLFVEGNDVPGRPDPAQEERHQAILRDFGRLAHLEAFEMTDVEVRVQGDEARVSYRIRSSARAGQEAPPVGGELRFTRQGQAWRLVDHRLIEQR